MRGSTSTLKEYTVEESLKVFREAGFSKLEMARGHLLLRETHELRQSFAAHAEELGLSMGALNAVGENYFGFLRALRNRRAEAAEPGGHEGRHGHGALLVNHRHDDPGGRRIAGPGRGSDRFV